MSNVTSLFSLKGDYEVKPICVIKSQTRSLIMDIQEINYFENLFLTKVTQKCENYGVFTL